jgi:hypothetical protein
MISSNEHDARVGICINIINRRDKGAKGTNHLYHAMFGSGSRQVELTIRVPEFAERCSCLKAVQNAD